MALSNKPPIFSFPKTEIPGWLFFCIFVAFASVRARAGSADSDVDDTLSDFTNDLFTDLGPLLALFGEQMTKQYISESTTYYDYFIFGMGPIGVITTIVSTIRLCGPASLRAFIGRSQEGNSAIEAELCTSTSRDVCEVFNNGGITRVLGRPKILELIHVPKHYLRSVTPGREMNREVGLYQFRDFVEDAQSAWTTPEWKLSSSQQLSPASQNPPNLSLNVGITQYDPWVFCLAALAGLTLQAGVLVVAGVGVWVLGWNLNESTTASKNYAPTIIIIGTVLLCGGMCACIAIIGQVTTEVRCKRANSVTGCPATSLIWLQPRQVIADQNFDAYAFIEDEKKRLLVWTSSMKSWDLDPENEIRFKSATCVAVSAVLVGTAFPLAAKQGWFEAVDAMLSLGFDPLSQDEAGRTALGYCAEYGHFAHEVCAEIILSHENAADALKSVSWSTDDGCTPLLLAIDQGHEEMVRILLKNGCAVNEQGGREFSPLGDRSPLGDAITKGLEGIVRQLIDAGAELRPDHIDAARDGNSPDIKQLIYGYLRLLVHESPDRWMQHLADIIEYGDVETVQMLLQRGAIYSFEHIVLAVKKGQPEVQRLLLELVHKYVDEFPIHTKEWLLKLAEENDHDTLQALLDHGASAVWDGA
ncbi:ankyrin repeat domain-containing protein 28 [Colletotrichum camelliae]|nr:ankyrin repeat domain-containing protein 28 [Colletotrichum camelliae]